MHKVYSSGPVFSYYLLGKGYIDTLVVSVYTQIHSSLLQRQPIIGERERANLVVQPARFFCLYIYPALMYAVMFYVILNKRKRLGDCVTFLASGTHEGDTMQRLNAR